MTKRTLDGLLWRKSYITQLGCIKACLEYMGRDISFPWLYGGTGYGFAINIQETLDPSGPTCWDTQILFDLAPNLGYKVTGFSIEKIEAGEAFPKKQRQAWDFVRASLDHGLPCYGWELHPYIPDYYIINGYDDGEDGNPAGYFYSGWISGGPRDWRTLGDTDVKVLQVYSIELVEPAPDKKVVKDALTTVIQHSASPSGWFSHSGYASGPAGFDLWAEALETGRAIRDGHSYNAISWLECREMVVEFLHEARQKLPGCCEASFEEAVDHYTAVCAQLRVALSLNPFRPEIWDNDTRLQSAEVAILMRQAGVSERRALECLRNIVVSL